LVVQAETGRPHLDLDFDDSPDDVLPTRIVAWETAKKNSTNCSKTSYRDDGDDVVSPMNAWFGARTQSLTTGGR